MTQSGYALMGLTAIMAVLVSVLTFAVLRFAAAARDARDAQGTCESLHKRQSAQRRNGGTDGACVGRRCYSAGVPGSLLTSRRSSGACPG